MKFIPENDYKAARKIGIPIFALWIANTVVLLVALMLRWTSGIYYSMGTEILFSLPLYLIISRNPVPPSELEAE